MFGLVTWSPNYFTRSDKRNTNISETINRKYIFLSLAWYPYSVSALERERKRAGKEGRKGEIDRVRERKKGKRMKDKGSREWGRERE